MNKGNSKLKGTKQVSVAAAAHPPPPMTNGEHTPCDTKRRYMARMTPFFPTAYISVLAGSDDEGDGELEVDEYANVESARTDNTPPKKRARMAGRPCHMYCQIGKYNDTVMWFRLSPVLHAAYAFCNDEGMLKGRNLGDWLEQGFIYTNTYVIVNAALLEPQLPVILLKSTKSFGTLHSIILISPRHWIDQVIGNE
jgi:hypothetical protein